MFAAELLELLHYVLVFRVGHVKYLHALLPEKFQEWNRRHDGNTHTLHVVNVFLPFASYGHRTSQTVLTSPNLEG